ncbi:ribosome biogenesis/translation initiation ATPase RLI [Salinarchaeum sp. IM2453]|uniref:ribosome biogenesis/translation initiation ATPase RLI n=1 Tax=Salinarchaeum sp. IM2453 TaxID=2862870 RepID=UPI001C830269|nr:ribosome biogenesis/translation initiation ATPase RLI [Salinarchaeum sp. IM2453]QZA88425.1 ribosome biogenesis/translation initiation ATPase RLI [Salinarchaeum sp. IM2453]
MTTNRDSSKQDYIAVIDQDKVTEEVKDIAVKYDPLNRSGHEGFHVTEDGKLHIDDALVMAEHRLIEKKIPNDAIKIIPLPTATGELAHQYGENGFRLYNLPAPEDGSVIGLLGRNGIGKSTALQILSGNQIPNFGNTEQASSWEEAINTFRGTTLQNHLESLQNGEITTAYKPQQITNFRSEESRTVADVMSEPTLASASLLEMLDLSGLEDRQIRNLSGGELQRLAIAVTLLSEADLYIFDEPSSFLDIEQRLIVGRAIREWTASNDAAAMVVEHDLAMLDLLADSIHVVYGEPSGFGVISQRLSTREGINQFLEGRLQQENVQIRQRRIEFPAPGERSVPQEAKLLGYPTLTHQYDSFSLSVNPGEIHAGESLGIIGANALGKTTFAKLLAGAIDPQQAAIPEDVTVSYKPQYLSADNKETVQTRLRQATDITSQRFITQIRDPFELEELYDRHLDTLSGGELQRVGIALCFARDADVYVLDEPSAFLDVDRRAAFAKQIRRFARRRSKAVLVIDHDLLLINHIADRLIVFEGTSGENGVASSPQSVQSGMNQFLSSIGITFRRDERTDRPRVNKPDSKLDREQKRNNEYYST